MPYCDSCTHCHPTPDRPQYDQSYGWCNAPLPYFLNPGRPLILIAETEGLSCPAYKKRRKTKSPPPSP